jgi:hypothetical protein
LPVRPKRAEDRGLRRFEPAENAPKLQATMLRPAQRHVRILHDLEAGRVVADRFNDDGLARIDDIDWQYGTSASRIYSIAPDDPLSATVNVSWRKEYAREGFHVRVLADTRMTAAEDHFLITATLDAYEGEARAFSKEWMCRIPRDHL